MGCFVLYQRIKKEISLLSASCPVEKMSICCVLDVGPHQAS